MRIKKLLVLIVIITIIMMTTMITMWYYYNNYVVYGYLTHTHKEGTLGSVSPQEEHMKRLSYFGKKMRKKRLFLLCELNCIWAFRLWVIIYGTWNVWLWDVDSIKIKTIPLPKLIPYQEKYITSQFPPWTECVKQAQPVSLKRQTCSLYGIHLWF